MSSKLFNIDFVLQQVEIAVEPYPKAGLFELVAEGFDSPFELLVACIISIRTSDEVMLPTVHRLFAQARMPQDFVRLTPEQIDQLIRRCTFHERKAQQIHAIAQAVVEKHGGNLACDRDVLLSFKGVGPKCANLVMGIACHDPQIGVDIHVHRITNRWGYVQTKTPEQTMSVLEKQLPRRYWVEINRFLVPFGKHICTGRSPRCSTCAIFDLCKRIGVNHSR